MNRILKVLLILAIFPTVSIGAGSIIVLLTTDYLNGEKVFSSWFYIYAGAIYGALCGNPEIFEERKN